MIPLDATTWDSISWLYSCDKSTYIRSVYNQCHVDLLKCTDQNINNETLTQVSEEKLVKLRIYCEIDMEYFRKDLHEGLSIVDYESNLKAAVTAHDHVLKQLLNKHAPEQENVVTIRNYLHDSFCLEVIRS